MEHVARRCATVAGLASMVAALTACGPHVSELGADYKIVNDTQLTLHVASRHQAPGAPMASASPVDVSVTLAPGDTAAPRGIPLSGGNCLNITLLAYDPAGTLIAQQKSPLCDGKNGNRWTIRGTG